MTLFDFDDIFKPVDRQLRVHSRINRYDKDILVSATQTRNYALNDPCIDWLKTKLPHMKNSDFVQHLMNQGNLFEKMTLSHILSRAEFGEVKQVVETPPSSSDLKQVKKLYGKTKALMLEGCPVIYQGCLYSKKNNVWGIADFIIRSDYINLLVNGIYGENEVNVQGRGLGAVNYHYVIIDTKWSTVNLLADGLTVSNAKKSAVYKYQLAVYSMCLEEFQKAGVQIAFVLGRRYKVREDGKEVLYDDIFQKAGRVDFNGSDSAYIGKALNAVKWIRQVRTYGHTWSILPQPSRPELYPNMKNYSDDPYRPAKEYIANKIREITSVWYCGYFARQSCFDNNIFQWTDPRCTSNTLSLSGKKVAPIVDAILTVNRSNDIIHPAILTSANSNWLTCSQDSNTVRFFVDFEFDNCLYDTFDKFPKSTSQTITYMIGVGHIARGKWNYQNFLVDNISKTEETRIFKDMLKYISTIAGSKDVYLYHWSPAERSRVQQLEDQQLVQTFNKYKWIDMLSEIKATPIVVKGALNFGLKTYGKALYNAGKISTCWKENETGLDTITAINVFNNLAKKKKINIKDIEGHQTIVEYNEVDCKVICEIFEFMYQHYIVKDDSAIGKRKRLSQSDEADPIVAPKTIRRHVVPEIEYLEPTYTPEWEEEDTDDTDDYDYNDDFIDDSDDDFTREIKETMLKIAEVTGLDKLGLKDLVELYTIVTSESYKSLDPHIKNLVEEYVRTLLTHRSGTSAYIETLNTIRYLTGSHSMYTTSLYDESLQQTVTAIKDHNQAKLVTYTEIAKAEIPVHLKADLYERLVRLHTYGVLDHDFYDTNKKLRNRIENYKKDNFVEKIQQSKFNDNVKSLLMTKYKNMTELSKDDWDYTKWKEWMNTVLSIPAGKFHSDKEVDTKAFLTECAQNMDATVHGLTGPKQSILEYLAELAIGKDREGDILCFHGSPGVGKSQLIQSLGDVTKRPIIKIELGGMKDVHTLTGHNFTYVGSQPGIIVRKLISKECQVADPIVVWEEMDKLADNSHAIEIQNKLIHILDPLQNSEFTDEYLGFPIDLSRCFHIISVNDPNLLHPVLRDRLEIITVPDPTTTDKVTIVKNFFLTKFNTKFGFTLKLSDEVISYIINMTDEKGVRQLKRYIKKIYRKINLTNYLQSTPLAKMKTYQTLSELLGSGNEYIITTDIVDKCITKTLLDNKPPEHWYT